MSVSKRLGMAVVSVAVIGLLDCATWANDDPGTGLGELAQLLQLIEANRKAESPNIEGIADAAERISADFAAQWEMAVAELGEPNDCRELVWAAGRCLEAKRFLAARTLYELFTENYRFEDFQTPSAWHAQVQFCEDRLRLLRTRAFKRCPEGLDSYIAAIQEKDMGEKRRRLEALREDRWLGEVVAFELGSSFGNWRQSGEDELSEVVRYWREFRRRYPYSPFLRRADRSLIRTTIDLASHFEARGETGKALDSFASVLDIPMDRDAVNGPDASYLHFAKRFEHADQLDRAEKTFQKYAEVHPNAGLELAAFYERHPDRGTFTEYVEENADWSPHLQSALRILEDSDE